MRSVLAAVRGGGGGGSARRVSLALRPYQIQAIERVRSRFASGVKRLVLVLATGGGKTVVASHIIASAIARGTRVCFIAHRRELIKQAALKLIRNGIDPDQIGIIMAGVPAGPARGPLDLSQSDQEIWVRHARRRPNALVQVASLDTVRSRAKPPANLVILDECHRARSKSNVELLSCWPDAYVCGLTATPYRNDNRGLGEDVKVALSDGSEIERPLFQDLVVVASPRLLVGEGFLVEPRVWTVPAEELPDISRVKIRGGDYDPEALNAAVDRDSLVGNVVDHYGRRARGVRAVAFPCSIAHSHHIVDRFKGAGVAAEHLDGSTPTAERDAILGRLERGETMVVSSVGVLCEGWDQPSVKCAMLLRPTKSTGLYLQMAGRILRPWQGQEAILLDHAGLTLSHGFVTDDREFSLEARSKPKVSAAPAKTCPSCYAVIPSNAKECAGCGHVFVKGANARPVPEEAEGELIEVVAPDAGALKASWEKLSKECAAKGYQPSWTTMRFSEMYPGQRPPEGCSLPTQEDCAAARSKRALLLDKYIRESIARGTKIGAAKFSFKSADGSWPSYDLFLKCPVSEDVRGVVAGLASMVSIGERAAAVSEPAVQAPARIVEPIVQPIAAPDRAAVPVANDVETVVYDLGA